MNFLWQIPTDSSKPAYTTPPQGFPQSLQIELVTLAFSIPVPETHSHSSPMLWGACKANLTIASSDYFL